MIVELLAGAFLATLAIGYVLRPIVRPDPSAPSEPPGPPEPPQQPHP